MDLVVTQDAQLLLRHNVILDDSTDVLLLADTYTDREFAGKNSTHVIEEGGPPVSGYFAAEFPLDTLLRLHAEQAMPHRSQAFAADHLKLVPFSQMLDLFKERRAGGAELGLYVEMKNPWFHSQLGLDIVSLLLFALRNSGVAAEELARYVAVQCFDLDALARFSEGMRAAGLEIPLVWLVDCSSVNPSQASLERLKALSRFTAVGVEKTMLIDATGAAECGMAAVPVCSRTGPSPMCQFCAGRLNGGIGQVRSDNPNPTAGQQFVRLAHSLGVLVHVWTLRNEDQYLMLDFDSDPLQEMDAYLLPDNLGVDGAFVDCPPTAMQWRKLRQPLPTPVWPAPLPPLLPTLMQPPTSAFGDDKNLSPPPSAITVGFLLLLAALILACCGSAYWYRFGPASQYARLGEERAQALAKYGIDLDELDATDIDGVRSPPQWANASQPGTSGLHAPERSNRDSKAKNGFSSLEIG